MGRTSNKDNKTQYQICRENMGYSREKASEVLGWISADRIERIENGGFVPRSDEVLEMSRGYRNPNLCNYYCAHECPIGQQYVPEIKVKDLSRIVLEMLASLNAMQKKQERLIEITADGQISEDEMIDFVKLAYMKRETTFITPRTMIRDFIQILDVKCQNPDKGIRDILAAYKFAVDEEQSYEDVD